MSPSRIIGVVLLAVGLTLLIIGFNATNSVADQVSNTFLGHFTRATTWYILSGIVASIFGILLTFTGFGRHSTP